MSYYNHYREPWWQKPLIYLGLAVGVFFFFGTIYIYAEMASNCSGIMIRDAMGVPRCIQTNNVGIMVR